MEQHLRPIERCVTSMHRSGLDPTEIGRRINRSSGHVERMIRWAAIPRTDPPAERSPRAIERRVLHLRGAGESLEAVAARFKRSPRSIRQIEGLAHYRLALELLGREDPS